MTEAGKVRLVQAWRSPRQEGMYLIVDRSRGLEAVPEGLLERFGPPEPSVVFPLTPDRTLAQADAEEVLEALESKGYWLQMPPADAGADLTGWLIARQTGQDG